MKTLYLLTMADLKMFIRNKQAVFFTFFMPLVIMTLLGLLVSDNVAKVDVGVAVTAPPTQGTRQFVDQLKEIEAFDVTVGTERDERDAIQDGERSVVLIIPYDLFPEGQSQGTKAITVLRNQNDPQLSGTALAIVNQILDKTTLAMADAPKLFEVKDEAVNSRDLKYIDFLIPGIVAMSIMQMCVFSVAFVFVDYKEKGVMKRLLATPMKPWQFVGANVITRLMVAMIQTALLIAVGVIFFDAQIIGSYWLILLILLLGATMFLGMGFTMSGLAKTVQAVPAIANLIVFPMLFLGGTFFPRDSMPEWLQSVTDFLPLTPLSESIREVMINGAGFAEVRADLLWMLGWAAVLIVAANTVFGFEEKRQ